jgi:hypothetical protein
MLITLSCTVHTDQAITKTEEELCHVMPVTGLKWPNTGKDGGGGGDDDDDGVQSIAKIL